MAPKANRQKFFNYTDIHNAKICAVTKGRSIEEVKNLLIELPEINIIAENRWPDCQEKFIEFKNLKRHFIGPLHSNKIKKVVPLVDCIQSVDSIELLDKINKACISAGRKVEFYFQVNISMDPKKGGLTPKESYKAVESYLSCGYSNVQLTGLMTIGAQSDIVSRRKYFTKMRHLFDNINSEYFSNEPLKVLSMGMTQDYQMAIECGSTMIRVGSGLF